MEKATFQYTDADVRIGLDLFFKRDFLEISWLPVYMDGSYPGGNIYMKDLILNFESADTRGCDFAVSLTKNRITGKGGYYWGAAQPMFQIPAVRRIGIRKGNYRLKLDLTVGRDRTGERREAFRSQQLGEFKNDRDRLLPEKDIVNLNALRLVDFVEHAQKDLPAVSLAARTAFSPEVFFENELVEGAQALKRFGCPPYESTTPAKTDVSPVLTDEPFYFHDRALGFYLDTFIEGYYLTGSRPLYDAADYCYRMLKENLFTGDDGRAMWGAIRFCEIEAGIHAGANSNALYNYFTLTSDRESIDTAYEVLKDWPFDEESGAPYLEFLKDGTRVFPPPFVYNMVMEISSAILLVAEQKDDSTLAARAKNAIDRIILGDYQKGGFWPYLRGETGISSHYGTYLLYRLTTVARKSNSYRDDATISSVIKNAAEYCLSHYAWDIWETRAAPMVVWTPIHGAGAENAENLCKSAYMSYVLAFLWQTTGEERYRDYLEKTLRWVYTRREDIVPAGAWYQWSVLHPLLELSRVGINITGNSLELKSLRVGSSDTPERIGK